MPHKMQEKLKQKYRITEHGHFTRIRIVTLGDDYNPKTDSFREFIDEVFEDNCNKETSSLYFEVIE